MLTRRPYVSAVTPLLITAAFKQLAVLQKTCIHSLIVNSVRHPPLLLLNELVPLKKLVLTYLGHLALCLDGALLYLFGFLLLHLHFGSFVLVL